ncbi:MAG: dihydrofolate reductase family protein [Chitinophagales bacterium]
MNRKVMVYIAVSADGFIAGPDGDMSFLDIQTPEGEDFGYHAFIAEVDTVILGRKTYDWVMTQVDTFPHAHLESYIITSAQKEPEGNIRFYSGDPCALVRTLRSRSGKNIFVDGGAQLIQALREEQLIDTYIITIIPVLLGSGTALFRSPGPAEELSLHYARSWPNGMTQLRYERNRSV